MLQPCQHGGLYSVTNLAVCHASALETYFYHWRLERNDICKCSTLLGQSRQILEFILGSFFSTFFGTTYGFYFFNFLAICIFVFTLLLLKGLLTILKAAGVFKFKSYWFKRIFKAAWYYLRRVSESFCNQYFKNPWKTVHISGFRKPVHGATSSFCKPFLHWWLSVSHQNYEVKKCKKHKCVLQKVLKVPLNCYIKQILSPQTVYLIMLCMLTGHISIYKYLYTWVLYH